MALCRLPDLIVDRDTDSKLRARAATRLRELIGWAASVSYDDVPPAVRRHAALVIVDDVAAMVGARDEPELRALHERVSAEPGRPESTLFCGAAVRVSRVEAAVANAVAANWCELDAGYRKVGCHVGLYTVPALIAEAEVQRLSAAEVIRVLAVAYEVVARFARCWRFPAPRSIHPHATFAAVGTAIAIGLARKLDTETLLRAISAASTLVTLGPFRHAVEGALIENCWAGAGAWNGFRAVDWAGCGIGGLATSPYDVYARVLGAESHPEDLTDGLSHEWAIADGYHKIYSCCQHAHASVEALLPLLGQFPPGKGIVDIAKVDVAVHRLALELDNARPRTTLGARFSMPQIIAATLVYGHAGITAFATGTLDDPSIASLRSKVGLRLYQPEMEWPNDRPARVTITFDGGSTLVGECLSARGGRDRPFSPQVILDKTAALTVGIYPDFAAVASDLVDLDEELLAHPWGDLVHRLTVRSATVELQR